MKNLVVGSVLVAALGAACAVTWRYLHPLTVNNERQAELSAAGVETMAPVDADALEKEVIELRAANDSFRREDARVLAAAPDAKPVEVVHACTGPMVAHGTPHTVPVEPEAAPTCACLLVAGDTTEARVGTVRRHTKDNVDTFEGAVSVVRTVPGPDTEIANGAFSAEATHVETLAVPSPGRAISWGVGIGAQVSGQGLTPTLVVAAPPVRFFSMQFDAVGQLGLGAGGAMAGVAIVGRP
jgi:hypothetical protein